MLSLGAHKLLRCTYHGHFCHFCPLSISHLVTWGDDVNCIRSGTDTYCTHTLTCSQSHTHTLTQSHNHTRQGLMLYVIYTYPCMLTHTHTHPHRAHCHDKAKCYHVSCTHTLTRSHTHLHILKNVEHCGGKPELAATMATCTWID